MCGTRVQEHATQNRAFARIAGLLAFLLSTLVSQYAFSLDNATPTDVNLVLRHARILIEQVRSDANVKTPWPETKVSGERFPRHVLQKCFEVLSKVNRVRVNRNMGAIAIPRFPTREITPNEVMSAANRLVGECRLLVKENTSVASSDDAKILNEQRITATHNYKLLSELSLALDPVLGLRGFSPGDVYAQSERVLKNAQFIRLSQNLPADVAKPERRAGTHPNHALKASVELLGCIATAESNLWMRPCAVPAQRRQKTAPNEVYDMLQIVLAEQQRIKYRLGVERHFLAPKPDKTKMPADVIQNIEWAKALMPDFSISRTLVQYDPQTLRKTPDDVYAIATAVTMQLEEYRTTRGIRGAPRLAVFVPNRQPKHVYQKTLECLEKINRLREQLGLGRTATHSLPLREITPTEVYDLTHRVKEELALISANDGNEKSRLFTNQVRTPSDVHLIMSRNSNLLDTIIGPQGYTPSDVYRQADQVILELSLLRKHLGVTTPIEPVPFVEGKVPRDVIQISHQIVSLMGKAQRRAGMVQIAAPARITLETITPNEVFNDAGTILTELVSLKVRLQIEEEVDRAPPATGKTPSDVYQKMEYARRQLSSLLGLEIQDGGRKQ